MTLIEIMIVIFIIGMVGSVIGYNMSGSIEEGRSFKSEHGSKQLHSFLTLRVAEGVKLSEIIENPEKYLLEMGFVSNPKKLLKDGWGEPYLLYIVGDNIVVYSKHWHKFLRAKKKKSDSQLVEDYPWAFFEDGI